MAIRLSLDPTCHPELDSSAESILAKVDIPGLKNVYICSYFKPKENDQQNLVVLRSSLSKKPQSSIIWAVGDFNLPHIDLDKTKIKDSCSYKPVYETFFDIIYNFTLEQMVKEPTRDSNILDLFLTNHPSLVQSTKTPPPLGQGDHDIVHHELKIKLGRNKQKQMPVKLYKKTDWDGFRSDMAEYQSDFFQSSANMKSNDKWNLFKKAFNDLSEKIIPTKLCRPKHGHPWVKNAIKRLMRKRDKLYAKLKTNRTNNLIMTKFTLLKHKIQKEIRQAYNQYLHSIITDQPEDTEEPANPNKRFWTLIKQQKSDCKEITSLKSNDTTYTKASDKAHVLNGQFQSVFTKLVPLKLKNLAELILPRNGTFPTMPDINITIHGVSKQLSKLDPAKASGPDNLTSRILKELHNEIAPMLTDIYNSSLREGKVQDDWWNAIVTSVYKKGPKIKAENYRSISLTCICCKVMEHVMTSNVMAYLDEHHLLHSNQHGFRKKTQLRNPADSICPGHPGHT